MRPTALAIEGGAVWVADYGEGSVAEVNARSGSTVATIRVGRGPTALAAESGAVWVANALDSTVSRIDRSTGSVAATVPVGSSPTGIAVAKGSVWVANQHSSSVSRIDQTRNAVVDTTTVGGRPTALAATGDTIWVGMRPLAQHRGGTLVLQHTRPISIDPALNVDLLPAASDGLTRDGLVTEPGPAGVQLVPNLAVGIPVPTDGGTADRPNSGCPADSGRPTSGVRSSGSFTWDPTVAPCSKGSAVLRSAVALAATSRAGLSPTRSRGR